ncbi:MAG: DNA-3-methyladenine glycosylase [Synergistaceae bacterium]|jgi:DNA-3-methyladenine glycosylase|nr:DNA-3-methyladenine glycosylase [Synergistaceae bacterium]
MDSDPLDREFYMAGAVETARNLLGSILVRRSGEGTASGMIVETEAYAGHADAACHSYKRPAPSGSHHRTNVMFGPGGFAYVYFIYGMHCCFNVVANLPGHPEAVLIRALEPMDGVGLMQIRRKTSDEKKLCSGPGKLCQALGITMNDYGADLCGGELFITKGDTVPDETVSSTPRINVDYAGKASALPYRFVIRDSKFLSTRRYLVSIPGK